MANKIPTTAQWSDLASKMNSKARITMTGTDPGEDGTLAENSLIGVYDQEKYIDTSDLADKAVTADKIDFTTLGNHTVSQTEDIDVGENAPTTVVWDTAIYTGTYFVIGEFDTNHASVGSQYLDCALRVGGSSGTIIAQGLEGPRQDGRVRMVLFGTGAITAGQQVHFTMSSYGGSITIRGGRAKMTMIRIG